MRNTGRNTGHRNPNDFERNDVSKGCWRSNCSISRIVYDKFSSNQINEPIHGHSNGNDSVSQLRYIRMLNSVAAGGMTVYRSIDLSIFLVRSCSKGKFGKKLIHRKYNEYKE